jgi:hypothetical protein
MITKHLRHFTLVALVCMASTLLAQVPSGINYQAIARDEKGLELFVTPVTVRFTIRAGSANGTLSYQETQSTTTNQFGLFTLVIGQGTRTGGATNLSTVDWKSAPQFLSVELSLDRGINYLPMGSAQYMSVPYAFVANQSRNADSSVFAKNLASGSGSISIPSGSTAQRPTTSKTGDIRYNTQLGTAEIYNGTAWLNINTPPIGATYVQWANAANPNTIYPNTTWVSSDMQNGEFIRAQGGNSLNLGVVQQDAIQQHGHVLDGRVNGLEGPPKNTGGAIKDGVSTDLNHTHGGGNTSFMDRNQTHGHTATQSNDGSHAHSITYARPLINGSHYPVWDERNPGLTENIVTNTDGGHDHQIIIGDTDINHTHTFTTGGTKNTTNGLDISLDHTHSLTDHSHTNDLSVNDIKSGARSDQNETRPVNVAVIFWRRTN